MPKRSTKQSSPVQFAYHVTLREFLPSIRKEGLTPCFHHSAGEPVIFVERSKEEAEIYAEASTVTLRFPVDGFGCTEDGEDVLYDRVDPKAIDYFEAGVWKKLKNQLSA